MTEKKPSCKNYSVSTGNLIFNLRRATKKIRIFFYKNNFVLDYIFLKKLKVWFFFLFENRVLIKSAGSTPTHDLFQSLWKVDMDHH